MVIVIDGIFCQIPGYLAVIMIKFQSKCIVWHILPHGCHLLPMGTGLSCSAAGLVAPRHWDQVWKIERSIYFCGHSFLGNFIEVSYILLDLVFLSCWDSLSFAAGVPSAAFVSVACSNLASLVIDKLAASGDLASPAEPILSYETCPGVSIFYSIVSVAEFWVSATPTAPTWVSVLLSPFS